MFFSRKKSKRVSAPDWTAQRTRMVSRDLEGRDIVDPRVLDAMGHVPRERFLPSDKVHLAYADHAVPIGHRQTISQPYIVALTMQLASPRSTDRALEIGCGSGYAAAVLAQLTHHVTTVEIVPEHAEKARDLLAVLGVDNVEVVQADGSHGHLPGAPYDVIVSAAAPQEIPEALTTQLAIGGRLVIPVGGWSQRMVCVTRETNGELTRSEASP